MEHIYKFIIESISPGKIEKKTAVELIRMLKKEETKSVEPVAIIGAAVKLPMADSLQEFWENIHNDSDCIKRFPESRRGDIDNYFRFMNMPDEEIEYNDNAYLDEIDKFDYRFFRLSPKEAGLMDPNQRIFLETAWKAVEDAGYGGKKLAGSNTGVYLGFAPNLRDMYSRLIYDTNPQDVSISAIGNLTAITPSRIAYIMDLKGPSMVVDTACSASLVAIDLACQAIRNGYCDMAIAGGVKINTVPLKREYMKIGIESSDDRTRAFDDSSDGSGIGEGAGVVILKPLKRALEDNDHIYSVIIGSAVNQDGNSAGITAPNPAAQAEVIAKAWQEAGIDPETISYIETHGTGTKLGDPIEVKGIKSAFRKFTDKNQFCAISSLKTNLGHLSEPAGVVSLIKGMLALKNKEIPSSLYFKRPNRVIDFPDSPVYVNTKPRKWEQTDLPRRCGISAFGMSGTNCHIVLEEAPVVTSGNRKPQPGLQVLALSAKNKDILNKIITCYKEFLGNNMDGDITDICFTTNTGRGHYNCRLALIVKDLDDLARKIDKLIDTNIDDINDPSIFYGEHKIVPQNKEKRVPGEITEWDRNECREKADETIMEFMASGGQDKKPLEVLCRLYIQGAEFDWDNMYEERSVKRISVPAYPFEKNRCWLEIPELEVEAEIRPYENFYYSMGWCEELLDTSKANLCNGTVLVLKDCKGMGEQVASGLRQKNCKVVEVELGEQYRKIDEFRYVINGRTEDFGKLLDEMNERNLSTIIHLYTLDVFSEINTIDELGKSQIKGAQSLFNLIRSIAERELDNGLDTVLVSSYVNEVSGKESVIRPENSPFIALGRVVCKEHPGMGCRAIDIDDFTEADDIISELAVKSEGYMTAFREGSRYVEEFRPVYIDEIPNKEVEIKESGVYIITGGAGGMGIEVSRYLTAKNKVKLALVNRSKIPDVDLWDTILEKGQDTKACKLIKDIREIEACGSEVICYSADIADYDEMKAVIDDLKVRFGGIDGVIHAAGVGGTEMIINRKEEIAYSINSPKIYGTWILDKLTSDEKLDFFVMFSSVSSMFSAPGQGDYMSANAYQDSYASCRNKLGKRTLTVNWTTWKEVGMAADHHATFDTTFKALTTKRAMEGFDKVFNKNLTRVLIGEIHYKSKMIYLLERFRFKLDQRIQKELSQYTSGLKKSVRTRQGGTSGEIILVGNDSGEYREIEKKLARICRDALGFNEINIHESFFEMGADSILLSRMHSQLEKEFPGKLSLVDLFSYTTISTLAGYITGQGEDNFKIDDDLQEFENMFEEIEKGNLSIDDALKNIYEE